MGRAGHAAEHRPGATALVDRRDAHCRRAASDGTLRYLCLVAALLTVDPPPLLVLNEPETSLHPDLLAALGRLIRTAAERSQVMVVSHSETLIRELAVTDDEDAAAGLGSTARRVTLVKDIGETFVGGQGPLMTPQWDWGTRR